MSKFLLITKINLLSIFNSTRINNSKYKSERRKKTIKILGIMAIIIYILWYVYYLSKTLMPAFISLGKPLYLLAFLFAVCTIFIFFSNVFKIKGVIFDFKDYDLLMSLPIKRNIVITSKIVSLYIVNLLYTIIVMIPGYVAYISFVNLPNDFLFFFLLFTIPIIPILAAIIVGIVLSWFISFFKNKNIGSYIIYLLLVFIVLSISFRTGNMTELDLANKGINIVDSFSHYYPFATLFVNLLSSFNFINLLIYIISPVLLMLLFILFINKGYMPLRTRLLKENIKTDYEIEGYRINSSLKSLYLKELKKYFSNALYVINTAFGCVILIFLIISLLLFNDYMITRFSKILDMNEMIKTNVFMIFSLICVLSSTTNSSISLEGKSLWIMKMLPVSSDRILLSKVLVNLTILIPTVILGGTFFGIYLHLPFMLFLLIYLLPLAYSIFTALGGLLLNLIFPKFDFDNEIRVIKQSLPVFLTILIGIISVIIPFRLMGMTLSAIVAITSMMFLIDIILAIVLHFYGARKMVRL